MSKVNIRALNNFIKLLEPIGDDHLFNLHEGVVAVKSIEGAAQIIGGIQSRFIQGVDGDFGMSITALRNMLPTGFDDVEITFGKQWEISAIGFKSKVTTLDPIHCCRVPKKDLVPNEQSYPVIPQEVYDRLNALKKVFGKDDGAAFRLIIEPDVALLNFSDNDSAVGEMQSSVLTTYSSKERVDESYSYDTAMSVFHAIRLQSKSVHIRFMDMPGNDACHALMVEGETDDPNYPITFRYVLAPRIKT